MIEIAVKLVEAMRRGQELVFIAKVIFAELTRGVALRFEKFRNGRVFLAQAEIRARQADLRQARAQPALAGDEGRATGGAALLAVIIRKDHALLGDEVDVGRAIAHHPIGVGADVRLTDVVAPDDDDMRFLRCFRLHGGK